MKWSTGRVFCEASKPVVSANTFKQAMEHMAEEGWEPVSATTLADGQLFVLFKRPVAEGQHATVEDYEMPGYL